MQKIKVLFVCVHNSARSQMAEALLKKIAGDKFDSYSAGIEPGELNPLAVEAMRDIGIDISQNRTKSVYDYLKQGERFGYVITVCDQANGERCPIFPGPVKHVHMEFQDPSAFMGTNEEKLEKTRKVRDQIESGLKEWIKTV